MIAKRVYRPLGLIFLLQLTISACEESNRLLEPVVAGFWKTVEYREGDGWFPVKNSFQITLYPDGILVFDGIKGRWDVGDIALGAVRLELPKNRFQSEVFEMMVMGKSDNPLGYASAEMMYRGQSLKLHQTELGGLPGHWVRNQPKNRASTNASD